jgi:hypothetical protein
MPRRAPLLACALLALAPRPAPGAASAAVQAPSLPPQTSIYYNARIALREGRHHDVLRLWLLRNALVQQGEAPRDDSDFRSALWVALAGAGLCHDGIPDDEDGAGLWPLALHNWLVRSTSKEPPPPQPRTFTSFEAGFQQRRFSLYDVLSTEEVRAARFARGRCLRPYLALPRLNTPHWLDLSDRLSVGITMRDLLERAQQTLRRDRVRGEAVLETRLFDLELALGRLAKAAVRRDTGLLGQLARTTGVSEAALTLRRQQRLEEVRQSEYTALLRRCLSWDELSWFSLREARRLALFAESVEAHRDDPEVAGALRRAFLQNVDSLLAMQRGAELEQWLGFVMREAPTSADDDSPRRDEELVRALVLGERGERLLGMGPEAGFRERAAVALWRGTDALQRGEMLDAMRSFALAMQRSEESRSGDEAHRLAKRWFAYVLALHEADEESLALLREFVSPLERNELLEVLLWRAAFHADAASFERIAASARRGGALDARIRQLRALAGGDAGGMGRQVRDDFEDNPHQVYRFVQQLTEELATEPLDVRQRNQPTLRVAKELLAEVAQNANRGLLKRVHEQLERMQVLLDSLELYDESAEGRARAAAPGAETYAGSLRLAPADPLPWPFALVAPQPPSPFTPLQLTPIEWLDEEGVRVFGWHIHER